MQGETRAQRAERNAQDTFPGSQIHREYVRLTAPYQQALVQRPKLAAFLGRLFEAAGAAITSGDAETARDALSRLDEALRSPGEDEAAMMKTAPKAGAVVGEALSAPSSTISPTRPAQPLPPVRPSRSAPPLPGTVEAGTVRVELQAQGARGSADADSPAGKLQRLREELQGPLSSRVRNLPNAPAAVSVMRALDVAKTAAAGSDHVAAENKVVELKRQLQNLELLNADVERLRHDIAGMANIQFFDKAMRQHQKNADGFEKAGLLEDAKNELERLKELLNPDAALQALEAELVGPMAKAVALQPADAQKALLQRLYGALAAVKKSDLQGAKAEVRELKERLDPVLRLKAEKNPHKRIAIAQDYLEANPGQSKVAAEVEDLLAEALKQAGVELTMQTFLDQLAEKSNALNPGGAFSIPSDISSPLDPEALRQVMSDTGLTQVEVLAIRRYTGMNYMIINPAIANQRDFKEKRRDRQVGDDGKVIAEGKDWMDQNRPEKERAQQEFDAEFPDVKTYKKGRTDPQFILDVKRYEELSETKSKLYERGALLAAFAKAAIEKLPPKVGQTYRGMRMSQAAFDKAYREGMVIADDGFSSQSTDKAAAEKYAQGKAGSVLPKPGQTTHVLITTEVVNARDVKAMSQYQTEDEWTMLPGSAYEIERIEKLDDGPAGEDPAATAWRHVYMRQVFPKAG